MASDPSGDGPNGGGHRASPRESVGFLLSQLGYETASRFGKLMRQVDLEPRQFALMRAIEEAGGQSQNAIAEALRIPPSSMVSVIDDLEARDFVERRPHPTDRRTRMLYLTPKGRRVVRKATALAMTQEATICDGLTADERRQLIEVLSRVAANLGLIEGVHPGTSSRHGRPHWSDEQEPA